MRAWGLARPNVILAASGQVAGQRTPQGSLENLVAALRPGPGLVSVDVKLLSDEEITAALAGLPGWSRSGDSITTTVELADFRAAMLYTGAVAYLAEAANHHPDVLIQWNKVTLTLSTHSAGGLTGNDTALAERINALS